MEQNYANHRRWVPMYHFVTSLMILLTLIGAGVNLYKSFGIDNLYSASLIFVNTLALLFVFFFSRTFAIKAQDRAIRAEENLRHFVMDGKLIDPKVTVRQIIGLRFASDDEFLDLEQRALKENLSETDIKKAVKNWRADTYRA